MRELADLSYWFPILRESGVRVPETRIVQTEVDLVEMLDGKLPKGAAEFLAELTKKARDLGFPCFLRTGQGSGKHDWERTCYVPSEDVLESHVVALVEWSHLVDFFGLPHHTWVVREFLPLVTGFKAFYGKMPVNRERRYFIRDGRVECHHPYWSPDSIENASDPDYRIHLWHLNTEKAHEVEHLTAESFKVAEHFDGYWSLDWAETTNGDWYAIDMAPGDRSFHWPQCPEERVSA